MIMSKDKDRRCGQVAECEGYKRNLTKAQKEERENVLAR